MAKLTHYSNIVILDDRQRKEFDAGKMQELFQSIEICGILNPPVTRQYLDQIVLVAGERRLKTMIDMHDLGITFTFEGKPVPAGMIPYSDVGELSVLQAEEAELDENLKRADLTWQEHAAAVNRLNALREKQGVERNADYLQGMAARGFEPNPATLKMNVPTVASITRELYPEQTAGKADGELGSLAANVRKEIIVSQHLSNPSVAKAKTLDEAFKILKREEEAGKNKALAASVGATFTASLHEAHNVNCLHWMALPENAERFDVILTDPPYGMGADSFGNAGGKLAGIEHHYDDSPEAWRDLMRAWCPLAFSVAKRQAHAYVFCDIDKFGELKQMMAAAGWDVFRTPLIVYKTNSGRVPRPEHGPRRQYEILLYAIKGGKPVTAIYPDVIPSQADDNMSHGAQKPVMVYENLLQRSVRPGDTVLDAFSGSGTIFAACHGFKAKAVGLEMNPEYFGMGLKRLQDLSIIESLGDGS